MRAYLPSNGRYIIPVYESISSHDQKKCLYVYMFISLYLTSIGGLFFPV